MKAKPAELDQRTKAFYDRLAKEAAEKNQSALVIGVISEIADSTLSDDSAAKRLANIRYMLAAYHRAQDEHLAQLRRA
jgi:hypothetical protein